jgi:uncharacterized protein (DUF1697 family)
MVQYVAFLRGINVAGKWVKMEDVRKQMGSAGFENVETYIQSGNVFFDSQDKNEKTVQDKVARVISKLVGSEIEVAVFPRVELRVLLKANPFTKINAKPEDKKTIIFLVKDPREAKLPLFSTQKDIEVFYYRNRIALAISRKSNGKYDYPTALLESKWGVPATTRFWHTFENMLNEMK